MKKNITLIMAICLCLGLIAAHADTINGRSVTVAPVKNGVRADYFYIQDSTTRLGGLRVQKNSYSANVNVNDKVNLTGTSKTVTNTSEPYLELNANATVSGSGTVKPYAITCRGLAVSPGLLGKLVKISGKVKSIAGDNTYFTINDGYTADAKILVPSDPVTNIAINDMVSVIGAVSKEYVGPGNVKRVVIYQDTSTYAVSGKVTSSVTSGAISGATVYFSQSPNASVSPMFTATTDASGNYSKALPNGAWYIAAGGSGYETSADQSVIVKRAAVVNVNFAIKSICAVSGKVTSLSTGANVSGATVYFSQTPNASVSPVYTATTDASGNYSKSIPSGTWYVAAGATGYDTSPDQTVTVQTAPITNVNISMLSRSNLVAQYKFDETTGTTATDSSSSGRNGTINGATRVSGIMGNCLSFDGSNDTVSIASGMGAMASFTMTAWVALNRLSDWQAIFHCNDWVANAVHLSFQGSGVLFFSVNGNNAVDVTSGSMYNANNIGMWKHIAVVYDSAAKTVKFYDNATLNSTVTYTTAVQANFGPANIGSWNGGRPYSGKIDDFRVYNRVLTAAEISNLYTSVPKFTVSGRVTSQSSGQPIPGATVWLSNSPTAYTGGSSVTTDASGNYTFTGIVNGTYYVGSDAPNYTMSADQTVTVSNASVSNINFALATSSSTALISLDASSLSNGNLTGWTNTGTAGGAFVANGSYRGVVTTIGGRKCVSFDAFPTNLKSLYTAPSSITGSSSWTVDIVALSLSEITTAEECLFSWGKRGGTAGTAAQVNMCNSSTAGAVYHGGTAAYDMSYGSLPDLGLWHHITITYTSGTPGSEKVYVDGVLSATESKTLAIGAGQNMYIGSGTNSDGSLAAGCRTAIASINVYSGAKSATEVAALAADSDELINLDASGLTAGTITTWTNKGSLGGSFGNDTTTVTAATVGGLKAVTFSGSARMKSSFTAPAAMTGNSPWSVVAWVYNPAIDVEECFFSWSKSGGAAGTNAMANFGSSATAGAVDHGGTSYLGFATTPTASAWHNIAVTFDGTTEKVYVDGVLSSSGARTLSITSGQPCYIGCGWDGVGNAASNYLSGSINQLKVFNRALAPEEIRICSSKTVRVYLIGGQSNAVGCAPVSGLSAGNQYLKGYQRQAMIFIRNETRLGPNNYGWGYLRDGLASGYLDDGSGTIGPELKFGYDIAAAHPGEMIAIIKACWGGKTLAVDWRPPTTVATSGGVVGDQYTIFINAINEGKPYLNTMFTPVVKGMIWMQGEYDATNIDYANAYQTNLKNLISDVRTAVGNPNMAFVCAKIADIGNWTYRTTIWNAMDADCNPANTSTYIPYTGVVDAMTLPTVEGIHYNAEGQVTLGQRFAAKMVTVEQ